MSQLLIMRPLKLPEAAPRLGISVDTLRRWIKKGRIAATHYGGNSPYFLDDEEVERFKQAHTSKAKVRTPKKYSTGQLSVSELTLPRERWGTT